MTTIRRPRVEIKQILILIRTLIVVITIATIVTVVTVVIVIIRRTETLTKRYKRTVNTPQGVLLVETLHLKTFYRVHQFLYTYRSNTYSPK